MKRKYIFFILRVFKLSFHFCKLRIRSIRLPMRACELFHSTQLKERAAKYTELERKYRNMSSVLESIKSRITNALE